jgi:hypothetical protein
MYTQVFDPVSDSLGLSSIFAALPLLVLFVLIGVVRMAAQWAALIGLAVALLVAIVIYDMPVGQSLDSGLEGAAFGLFPIMWIVVNAIWIYNMTVESGHFVVLRRSFARISDDQRIQAIIIAFCFGALLEALAGFGTPVAITSVMLVALGFQPMKAAAVALVANTAPVAFGAIAINKGDARLVRHLFGGRFGKQEVGFIVNRKLTRDKPDLVSRIVASHVEAMRLFIGNPDRQIEYERKYSRLPDPVIVMQEKQFLQYDYRTNVSDLKAMATELRGLGWVKEDYSDRLEKYLDLSFLAKTTGQSAAELSTW